jgi:RNA-binding protein NOB1
VRYPTDSCAVRDEAARSRFQTTWSPFLKLRNPRPESIEFVTNFARRTGDLQVLSKPDIHLLALTYDLEVERNGGDWRLRNEPNQKRVNGKPPGRAEAETGEPSEAEKEEAAQSSSPVADSETTEKQEDTVLESSEGAAPSSEEVTADSLAEQVQDLNVDDSAAQDTHIEVEDGEASAEDDDDGDGEWISSSTSPLSPPAAPANRPQRRATLKSTRRARMRTLSRSRSSVCSKQP